MVIASLARSAIGARTAVSWSSKRRRWCWHQAGSARSTSSPRLHGRTRAKGAAWRGSEHGGVFLDIASRRPADYIKKRLPSMYHQFRELADVDITRSAMEVGPTCHYVMGGVRVEADTTATNVPGLFAAGEVAAG